jgi:hypothetical protein
MPNGDYSLTRDDWAKIRAFFQDISHTLLAFAGAHKLAIDEYYHDSPSWAFRFRHPKGGVGSLEVKRLNESAIHVNVSWHIDEYESFTQYFKWEEGDDLLPAKTDLGSVLEERLKEVVAWNKEDLSPRDAKNPWANYSKEEWEKMWSTERFPLVEL